jgi:hypothetical protein
MWGIVSSKDTKGPFIHKKEAPMTAQTPLFYSTPTPLDAQKHAGMGLKPGLNLGFAAHSHAVPVNVIEFPQVALSYPIVFSPDATTTPVAVLGLTEGQNLFVTETGEWAEPGTYIPSYIRRYPFLFASVTGTDQLTLCVDAPAMAPGPGPLAFFEQAGKPTAMTTNALEFCKSFHAATLQTQAFCAALNESGLLEPREAEIPLGNGQKIRFGGFRMINDKKFADLPDATFTEWRKKGWLPAVYAVLAATPHWNKLARLHTERNGRRTA